MSEQQNSCTNLTNADATLRFKYSPEHPVLKHPQSCVLSLG